MDLSIKLHRLVKTEGKFKIGHKKIKQWLQDQNSHGLSRNLVRKFPRNRYVVNTIDSLWEMADVSNIRSHNQNYKYLLFVIDVFSRYLWIQPITDKTSKSVINALKIVFNSCLFRLESKRYGCLLSLERISLLCF
jgi:hypothetical protein